jgi:hypothetical protein
VLDGPAARAGGGFGGTLGGLVALAAAFGAIGYFARGWATEFFFLFAFLVAAAIFVAVRAPRLRTLAVNVGAVFVALLLLEGYLVFFGPAPFLMRSGAYSAGGYFAPDPVRGYGAPRRAQVYDSRVVTRDGTLVYDIKYTIDANGLRVTPTEGVKTDAPAWFFGCSFMIGEGVRDEQTLPWVYAQTSGVAARNFGFHGYGPHQMLRMLETGYAKDIDGKPPSVAYYLALLAHIERSAGLTQWDKDGPKYVLENGRAKYAGTFSSGKMAARYADKILVRSLIYTRIVRPYIYRLQPADRDLYIAIVAAAADQMRDRYGAKLVVALWDVLGLDGDGDAASFDYIEQGLVKRGVQVVRVSAALGTGGDHRKHYIAYDGHPTAETHAKIARLLAK